MKDLLTYVYIAIFAFILFVGCAPTVTKAQSEVSHQLKSVSAFKTITSSSESK